MGADLYASAPHCRYCGGLCGPIGYCRRLACLERAAAERARAKAEKKQRRKAQRCSFCLRPRSHKHFAKTCGELACRVAYLQARDFARQQDNAAQRIQPQVLAIALAAQAAEAARARCDDGVWRQAGDCWVADVGGQRLALEPGSSGWLIWVGGRRRGHASSLAAGRARALKLAGAMDIAA